MSNRELPMMPWFPKEFAAATSTWSFAERSAYRALLDVQWEIGVLPTETWRLAQGIGMALDEFEAVWPVVRRKLHVVAGGLRNERLEEHRVKALRLSQGRKKGAETTNAKRTADRGAERPANRNAERDAERLVSATSPSPSPSPTTEVRPPHPTAEPVGRRAVENNGAGSRQSGTNPRARKQNPRALGTNPRREAADARTINREAIAAWNRACEMVDAIHGVQGRTWAEVTDPRFPYMGAAIRAAGGCKNLATRDRYTTANLKAEFCTGYRVACEGAPRDSSGPKSAAQILAAAKGHA